MYANSWCLVLVCLVVWSCGDNSSSPTSFPEVQQDLSVLELPEAVADIDGTEAGEPPDCAELCLGKECGLLGQCDCGNCGGEGRTLCNETTYTCECQPLCGMPPGFEGWECGQDGCGGECGDCPGDSFCDFSQDQATAGAGDRYDSVGGFCITCPEVCAQLELDCGQWVSPYVVVKCECGSCPDGQQCAQGKCDCEPDCQGKVCGPDGCGGNCGTGCPEGTNCASGKCVNCVEDAQCDDGEACTEDLCSQGNCEYVEAVGACDDGDVCTEGDHCEDGVCVAATKDCTDFNECTEDSCMEGQGCHHEPLSDIDCAEGQGGCIEGTCVQKSPTCPQNWVAAEYGGLFCYRPFNKEADPPLTWLVAEEFCEAVGGNLVSIHGEAENDFVKGLIAEQNFDNDTTWIGLNDIELEEAWKWVDETAVEFLDWSMGQPNNWGGCWWGDCAQHCVAIDDPIIGFGGWNDLECDEEFKYICKKPADWVAIP